MPAIILPELERECSVCRGTGRDCYRSDDDFHHGRRSEFICATCRGAGHVPTEFGQKVLELIKHNLVITPQDFKLRNE